jgi:CRISPR-associated protein Cas2
LPKATDKAGKLLSAYGQRVQYSVFECRLKPQEFRELSEKLRKVVKLSEDSVRMYPLSGHTLGQVELLGGLPLTQRQVRSWFRAVEAEGDGACRAILRCEPRRSDGRLFQVFWKELPVVIRSLLAQVRKARLGTALYLALG